MEEEEEEEEEPVARGQERRQDDKTARGQQDSRQQGNRATGLEASREFMEVEGRAGRVWGGREARSTTDSTALALMGLILYCTVPVQHKRRAIQNWTVLYIQEGTGGS